MPMHGTTSRYGIPRDHIMGWHLVCKFCKLLISCKNVQLHCARCHFSHLSCHPWQVLSVLKPESFLCLLMFEIQVPLICLQPENPDQADQPYFLHVSQPENLVTGILHILYLLTAYYYNPTSAKGSEKNFLPKFRPWHDSNHKRATKINTTTTTTNNNNIDKSYIWLHWHVSLTRLMFTYFFSDLWYHLVNPERTPTTVSLCDLHQLHNNFLPNHALWSHRAYFSANKTYVLWEEGERERERERERGRAQGSLQGCERKLECCE